MNSASQVSSCGPRVAPPRTKIVAGSRISARSAGRTGLVIGGSLQCAAAPIRHKKPRSRAGQGSSQNSRPFSASLAWPQAGRLKSTTMATLIVRGTKDVKDLRAAPPRSWPGLGLAIHESDEPVVEILPVRVVDENEPDLPSAPIVLQVLLSLPRLVNVVVMLGINEALQPIASREPCDQALSMLPDPARDIVRYADIKRAVWPVCHDVDPAIRHP